MDRVKEFLRSLSEDIFDRIITESFECFESKADLPLSEKRKMLPRFIDIWREDFYPLGATLLYLHPYTLRVFLVTTHECRHKLRRIIRLEIRRLIGNHRVAGGM